MTSPAQSSNFTAELEQYIVLKLALADYNSTSRGLGDGYRLAGGEMRPRVRDREKNLLRAAFRSWNAPFDGTLKGWRTDSPIYVLHDEQLIGAVYVCDANEFREPGWGQLHYAVLDPASRGQGVYSVMFREAVERARRWGLEGLYLNSDRYLLPELYEKWGARPWKVVEKRIPPPTGRFTRLASRARSLAGRVARFALRRG